MNALPIFNILNNNFDFRLKTILKKLKKKNKKANKVSIYICLKKKLLS